ncbi:MAG: T9SS type A sorting domain-containing protein [Bacteroidota bacterium]
MLRPVLTLCTALFVLGPPGASAQAPPDSSLSYFPLEIGNSWTYMHVLQHPFMPWDTLYREVTIDEEVIVNDTAYFLVPLPRMFSDTLRSSDSGSRIWMRRNGYDFLFYDFNVPADSSGVMTLPPEFGPDYQIAYSNRPTVFVEAGSFTNGLSLYYDIPEAVDDEFRHTFVAGVGLMSMSSAWGYRELASATVGGRTVTSVQSLPTTQRITASVYPNPARDHMTVTLPSPHHTPLSINAFDMLGRRVAQWQAAGDCDGKTCRADLSVANLAPGTYLLQARQGDWSIAHPLIVQR